MTFPGKKGSAEFRVIFGPETDHDDEIAIETRSAMRILLALAHLFSHPAQRARKYADAVGRADWARGLWSPAGSARR